MKILGIESSCDDTAVAIIDDKRNIHANIVLSQLQDHQPYAGVVPELAARAHIKNINYVLQRALYESELKLADCTAIAATTGPGLIGGVIVSTMFGKSLAFALNKPFIGINHLEGHALTVRLTDNVSYPYLLLLVSGGHCQFIAVLALGKYKILGQTLDDAAGEAFDKVAKMLGLGYPGGPIVEERAKIGEPIIDLPHPLAGRKGCDMSFSGLKTAVRNVVAKNQPLTEQFINNICASFQHKIANILVERTKQAFALYQQLITHNNQQIAAFEFQKFVVAGGVAANKFICSKLKLLAQNHDYNFIAPPLKLCTDNAAMIAWAGLERYQAGYISDLATPPRARWSLEEL